MGETSPTVLGGPPRRARQPSSSRAEHDDLSDRWLRAILGGRPAPNRTVFEQGSQQRADAPFAQQPRALRSTTRIGPTGKLTRARRCSAAPVCALSRARVRTPPPSLPTLTPTSAPVRCDRLFGRPNDPCAPPARRAGGDRDLRSNRPARPRTTPRSTPRQAKRARAAVAQATCRSARFAAQPTMVASALPRER